MSLPCAQVIITSTINSIRAVCSQVIVVVVFVDFANISCRQQ